MKKSRIVAPVPVKVVLQYRLIALVLLGALAIGVLYVPAVSDDVRLAPQIAPTPPNTCSVSNCHDSCVNAEEAIRCNCEGIACTCKAPQRICDSDRGEQCRINPVNGDAFCQTPRDPPSRYYCCKCGMDSQDYEWYYKECPKTCTFAPVEGLCAYATE